MAEAGGVDEPVKKKDNKNYMVFFAYGLRNLYNESQIPHGSHKVLAETDLRVFPLRNPGKFVQKYFMSNLLRRNG